MELPFKYMVLRIFRKLNDRNMSLVISKVSLVDYFAEFMKKSFFTIEEKRNISESFDFEYELDDLFTKYYKYFDIDNEVVKFDEDYVSDIDDLIIEEKNEYDAAFIHDIDFVIEGSTSFLEIIGVKIRKDLYNYLADLEKQLEECYNQLSDLENYSSLSDVDTSELISRIKKFNMTKIVMLLNAKNLLPKYEYYDLIGYAHNVSESEDYKNEITFLLESEDFDMSDIIPDVFLRSIFFGSDSYMANLRDRLVSNMFPPDNDIKYSTIKFYLTFLDLLNKEIGVYNTLLDMEFVRIKYRIMNTMDSVYGTTLFMGNNGNVLDGISFKERYNFICDAVYYFSREILMYDNEQYRNDDYSVDNTLVYLNNIMKKLLIETYYKLTGDNKIVDEIKGNPLYGINTISSGFVCDIVDKPKGRVKEK